MDRSPASWERLAAFKRTPVLPGYPSNILTFWSPTDDVHGMLVALLASASQSVVLNMYGYDDPELDATLQQKMRDEHVYVQMSLDSSQAGGVHERELLKRWPADAIGTSIAIGQSIKHAISHLKVCIVDGLYTVRGSTNWSLAGEQKQDNEITLIGDPLVAAETRSVLDINHDHMLQAMKAKA